MLTTTEYRVTSIEDAKLTLSEAIPGDIIVYHARWRNYYCKDTDELFNYFRKLEGERGGSHCRRVNGALETIFVVR